MYTKQNSMATTKTFISSVGAKSQGRYSYYKMLSEVRQGDLVKVKRGVYAGPEQLADTMVDIDKLVPNGILCSFSAWSAYGLTTVIPQAFHVAVKRGRKVTLPDFPVIELHYMTDKLMELGLTTKDINGYQVRIFDMERCVCDAIKFRNKIGQDVCSEVVNSYLKLPERNLTKLVDYAEKLRVKNTLNHYLEIVL